MRHPDIGGEGQLLMFAGATIPFARDRAEREASGDPRPSIRERYRSKDEYLEKVRKAAEALAEQRYLLDEDVGPSVERAAAMWDWFAGPSASRG